MGKQLVLILGGARSGKSSFAQTLAQQRGGDNVLFIATAQVGDEEMRVRIAQHRTARPATWRTLEVPREIARTLATTPVAPVVILDCVTLWVSNVLLADENRAIETMTREVEDLLAWYHTSTSELIIVSNEVGMGIVPDNSLARAYRDLLGTVNRKLAEAADEVFLLVAGLPVEIKSRAIRL